MFSICCVVGFVVLPVWVSGPKGMMWLCSGI